MTPSLSAALLRTQSDERLGVLAGRGSDAAFEVLAQRYERALLAYARRLGADGDAEDVVQQALVNTWAALERGTELTQPKAWLYRVVHNATLNAVGRSGRDNDELPEGLVGARTMEEQVEERAALRQVFNDLADLPAPQREALVRSVAGESQTDIARELGVSHPAVRALVFRARRSLREGAAAVVPVPLASWLAGEGWRGGGSLARTATEASRFTDLLSAGGGSAPATVAKGLCVVAAAGALAVGSTEVVPKILPDGNGSAQADDDPGRPGGRRGAGLAAARARAAARAARTPRSASPAARRADEPSAGSARNRRRGDEDRRSRGEGSGEGTAGDSPEAAVADGGTASQGGDTGGETTAGGGSYGGGSDGGGYGGGSYGGGYGGGSEGGGSSGSYGDGDYGGGSSGAGSSRDSGGSYGGRDRSSDHGGSYGGERNGDSGRSR